MKIISYNINGIRAARKKGLVEFIAEQAAIVVCFQEVKAQRPKLTEQDLTFEGYDKLYWAEAKKAGYSGVLILVKKDTKVISVQEKLGIEKFDDEGRTIVLELEDFYLINSYYPNGRDDHSRVDFKLEYSYAVLKLAKELENKKPVILTGDLNTAHFEIDLARPKENTKTTGFLPHERVFLDDLITAKYVDAFRHLHPAQKDTYSWWSYRTAAKARNIGWRIDYFMVSEKLHSRIKACSYIFKENASDHCPVVLELSEK